MRTETPIQSSLESSQQIRWATPASARSAFLAPHKEWIHKVLGSPPSETLILETDFPFTELVIEDLLPGIALDRRDLKSLDQFRGIIDRWELPPEIIPRIELRASRDCSTLVTDQRRAWAPRWKEAPVAIWLRGVPGSIVACNIPHAWDGMPSMWQQWVLVNRSSVTALVALLNDAATTRKIKVIGGRDILLPEDGYRWESAILDPGHNQAVREDYETFFKREQWFVNHRLPYRRGYLLYGPPGNGKTSVVRIMACHPQVSAFSIDFSNEDLANHSFSELFELAGESAPSLVILEDLDRAFGEGSQNGNRAKITLQHLLNCLDGLESQNGVVVVATANDPAKLDPAILRRPGRFDRLAFFPAPSPPQRSEYLRLLAGNSIAGDTIHLAARDSEGLSFAQVREAYILAGQSAYSRAGEIDREDLLDGVRQVRDEAKSVRGRAPVGFRSSHSNNCSRP